MATRSFFLIIRRNCNDVLFRSSPLFHFEKRPFSRSLSSSPSRFNPPDKSSLLNVSAAYDLKSRILRLRSSNRSAMDALQRWVGEGRKVKLPELRRIADDLRKLKRYEHALEILTWMEAQGSFQMSAADRAIILELMIRVHGLSEAEEYFETIPDRNSQKAACLPLLNFHVKERATKRAELFMLKLQRLGLTVTPHPFNEMMKLYMATCHFGKVPLVIEQMKRNRIPLNVLSYNLWMGACGAVSDVVSAEMVYKEMMNDMTLDVGWSTYSTLANIYVRSDLVDKAAAALRAAEQKLSASSRLGYFFLITQYAALNDKDGVLRLWEGSKSVPGKITCANYMCILSCLVKLGDVGEAEKIFTTWESKCRKYDIRVSNVLLGAYMRRGWMEKAEALHLSTLEKGGCPNYKTWEILMEGWMKNEQMDKVVEAMKKGFSRLRECHWRPSPSVVMAIAKHFEEHGSVEDACKYVKGLRSLNLVNLSVYKSLLRVHIHAQRPALDVLKMMERDKIDLDEETSALLEQMSKMNDVQA
ncbi:pentatricopeptide repeat-containing protein At5g27460 [Magnolia sinica]|uniref:pentatricopeptide repeat-containing protein At5g27460 n=1 Tax=Magnolia sinica TaxID=86752 RepID=UPI00265AF359|nr:pentatricopeptide repeat-containing protein At5g27460 [Magnolia sinica]